jgi:hypothetical protein
MGMRASAQLKPTALDSEHPALPTRLRDRRIAVSAITRARAPEGERTVRIVGLSARTALLVSAEPLGWIGQCVDVDVPALGGRCVTVMGGIVRAERCREGHAVTIEFLVVEGEVRRQLNELLALLLEGESGAGKRRPRVVYDVAVAYGPTGASRAHLQEISLEGLAMRTAERIAHDVILDVAVPTLRSGAAVALRGQVTGQGLSAEGGYLTALDFEPLDGTQRRELGVLVADLMCR